MIDPLRDLLAPLSARPAVTEAAPIIAQAVRPVRFSTGLRRQWKEARTEASIRALARAYEERRQPVPDLRSHLVDAGELDEPQASLWRCHCDAVEMMPDLNTMAGQSPTNLSARTVLARLYRDAHHDVSATDDVALTVALAQSSAPAVLRLSLIIAQWAGPTAVRDSFARWFMTSSGLEPTGLALPAWDDIDLSPYRQGTVEGIDHLVGAVTEAIVASMSEANLISRSILAGRPDTDYI